MYQPCQLPHNFLMSQVPFQRRMPPRQKLQPEVIFGKKYEVIFFTNFLGVTQKQKLHGEF